MSEQKPAEYLYLTTTGRKSGKPHQIEIWFVEHDGKFYMIHEGGLQGDWVKNILALPRVVFSIGSRDAAQVDGRGRLVDAESEPALAAEIRRLMDARYAWSDGQIVEIEPTEMRS